MNVRESILKEMGKKRQYESKRELQKILANMFFPVL
jgi:hypothetical protein